MSNAVMATTPTVHAIAHEAQGITPRSPISSQQPDAITIGTIRSSSAYHGG
jgi:hypothetical protein